MGGSQPSRSARGGARKASLTPRGMLGPRLSLRSSIRYNSPEPVVAPTGDPRVIEQWHTLTLEPGPRPALILDASESAAKLAPYLRSLAEGVIEAMPEANRPRVFF